MKRLLSSVVMAALFAAAIVSAGVATPRAAAQEQASSPQPMVPLRVTVVISRFQGETRKTNLPYTLFVNANVPRSNSSFSGRTSLRIGSQVPVPAVREGVSSYSYQSVGVNIDADAETVADGRIRLTLTVTDSGVSAEAAQAAGKSGTPPIMMSFSTTSTLFLKDGQTLQFTTAADKITGETVRLDVTASVVK